MKCKMVNSEGQERGFQKYDAMILETYCYHRDTLFSIFSGVKPEEAVDVQYHRNLMLENLRLLLQWEIIKNTSDLHTTWTIVK